MGVGIHVVGHAMGGPTGMGDADMAVEVLAVKKTLQIGDLALALIDVQRAVLGDQRDARAVVTAIFEPVEPFDKDRAGIAPADITYDSAHVIRFECEFTKNFGCKTEKRAEF